MPSLEALRPAPRFVTPLLFALSIIAFALPVALYWFMIGRAPSITPREAMRRLAAEPARALLVDVRAPASFRREHLDGANNWPSAEIRRLDSPAEIPQRFRGTKLLLLSQNGIASAEAALKLRSLGIADADSVKDGMCGWIASAVGGSGGVGSFCRLLDAAGKARDLNPRRSSLFEQWTAVATGFILKPIHMALTFALIIWLWRRRSPDLGALRWGMIAFFAGESACAANYLVWHNQSPLAEYLHSFGMVIGFGFAAYAMIEAADTRLLHFSDQERRCAFDLCGPCFKFADAACGLRRVFLILIPAVMVVGAMPFTAAPEASCYNTVILGTPYNYCHAVIYQIFETRFFPGYGLALLMASFFALLLQPRIGLAPSKVFFAAGLGPLGFGLLRFVLFRAYQHDLVWFALWEEMTEFLFVIGAAFVVWAFRTRLAAEAAKDAGTSAGQAA